MQTRSIALAFVMAVAAAHAQPVVSSTGIVSAATYSPGIAQGSMFIVFGSRMSADAMATAQTFPLPTTLGGTSVTVQAGGQTRLAPLVYTSSGQLAAVLPSLTPTGKATLTVSYSGQTSSPVTFDVVRSAFGIFTNNARGTGVAVAQNYISQVSQTRNGLAQAAAPGQVVTLWGTGLGPANGDDAAAPVPGNIDVPLEISIGGRAAKIVYQGRSGCCAGIDQVVVEVPAGVEGCYLPVQIRSAGVVQRQDVTLAVASKGALCTEPGLISAEDIERAKSAGNLKIGSLLLTRYTFGDQAVFDYGMLSFSRARYESLVQTNERLLAAAPGTCEAASWDGNTFTSTGPGLGGLDQSFFEDYLFWSSDSPIDAGQKIALSGGGKQVSFERAGPGIYFNMFMDQQNPYGSLQGYLTPGNYTLTSEGGPELGGFQTQVTVPEYLRFTDSSAPVTSSQGLAVQRVSRSSDLNLTWSGGSSNERVLIYGVSWSQMGQVGGAFTCLQRGAAGRFSVPASVMSVIPRSGDLMSGQGGGMIMLYSFSPYQRSSVNGLDAFYAATLNLSYKAAAFE